MSSSLTLTPIGHLRTRQQVKFQAGHQAEAAMEARNELELLPGQGYEEALRDLKGIERLWLVWWFHLNEGWRPLVLPPRGPSQRRGLFATRSPHRPNPLGITAVPLLGVEGRTLLLGACDLVDGTPILDIKPYIPAYDAFPEASAGWIDEVEEALRAPAPFVMQLTGEASERCAWLREGWGIDFLPRLRELLERDPSPHRTRRIRRRETHSEITCGAWRALYTVSGTQVHVFAIHPAYPLRFIDNPDYLDVPDREAQRAFHRLWPELG